MNTKYLTEGEFWFEFGEDPTTGLRDIANHDGDIVTGLTEAQSDAICSAHNNSVENICEKIRGQL